MANKKIPKWQTDADWALRRAKKRKERLPIEVEELFKGKPDHCLSYQVNCLSYLSQSLSNELTHSVCDHFRELLNDKLNNPARLSVAQKMISSWIINYVNNKGELTSELDNIFIEVTADHIDSSYDWGTARCLKMVSLLGEKISSDLENLIWSHHSTALEYSEKTGKRIPEQFEINHLKMIGTQEFIAYVKKIFKGRATEQIEVEILVENPQKACEYAEEIVRGKLPDSIHSSMIMKSFGDSENEDKFSIIKYLNFIKLTKNYTIGVLKEFDKSETVGDVLRKLDNF